MTSDKKPSNEISSALDKVDQEVAKIQQEKEWEKKRQQRQAPPVVKEMSRQEVINQQNLEDQKNLVSDIKSKAIFIALIFVTTLFLTYTLTKEERTSLIEQIILIFLCCGIVLAKKSKS